MNNKRKISFQIFIKVLKGKRRASRLLRAVAPVKCHQRTVWQVAEYYGSAAFLSRTSRQPSLSYSLQWNQPKTESNLQCQIPNIIASIHFITQKWCFHKFWKPQKAFSFYRQNWSQRACDKSSSVSVISQAKSCRFWCKMKRSIFGKFLISETSFFSI